jgi:uncharacterized C2H2 Zn-finger protein
MATHCFAMGHKSNEPTNTMNDRKTPTLNQLAQSGKETFRCSRCGKVFGKPQGLSMHVVRMHTPFGRRKKALTLEEMKERKRAYNRMYAKRIRKQNQAQGLTTRGTKVRTRFTPYVLHREPPRSAPAISYCPHCGTNLEKYL